jgi:putative transposase
VANAGHVPCDPLWITKIIQGQGKSVSEAVRQIGVTIQTYYRWRKEYGGMSRDQLKRLKELETENQRLKRVVADLSLDKMILTEAGVRAEI